MWRATLAKQSGVREAAARSPINPQQQSDPKQSSVVRVPSKAVWQEYILLEIHSVSVKLPLRGSFTESE